MKEKSLEDLIKKLDNSDRINITISNFRFLSDSFSELLGRRMNWCIFILTSTLILIITLYENLGLYSIWFYTCIAFIAVLDGFFWWLLNRISQEEWIKTCKNAADLLLAIEKKYGTKL